MGILTIAKQYLNIIIGFLVAGITFYVSSLYYNHKIDKVNNEYNNYKISLLTQSNKIKEDNEKLNIKLKEVENENYKNYTKLQKSNSTIKSNIANGTNRLYINSTCTDNSKTEDNSTSRVDDGKTSKAVIDARDGQSIIEITEKADKYKSQLEALQDYVNMLLSN